MTVLFNMVQHGKVQYGIETYRAVQYYIVRCDAVGYSPVLTGQLS